MKKPKIILFLFFWGFIKIDITILYDFQSDLPKNKCFRCKNTYLISDFLWFQRAPQTCSTLFHQVTDPITPCKIKLSMYLLVLDCAHIRTYNFLCIIFGTKLNCSRISAQITSVCWQTYRFPDECSHLGSEIFFFCYNICLVLSPFFPSLSPIVYLSFSLFHQLYIYFVLFVPVFSSFFFCYSTKHSHIYTYSPPSPLSVSMSIKL